MDNDAAVKLGCLELRRFYKDMPQIVLKKRENFTILESVRGSRRRGGRGGQDGREIRRIERSELMSLLHSSSPSSQARDRSRKVLQAISLELSEASQPSYDGAEHIPKV